MTQRLNDLNSYTVVRKHIAISTAGCVHEAISPDGARVALKIMNCASSENIAEDRNKLCSTKMPLKKLPRPNAASFRREFAALAGLSHDNLASIRGACLKGDNIFIAYDYIDGAPIAEFVRGWHPKDMMPLFVQALRGIDHIHSNGLLHLDIKSDNVMVENLSSGPRVRIIDFGVAARIQKIPRVLFGSPSSVAPEVALGLRDEIDRRADLFSFGVLMYRCATWGQMPYGRPLGANIDTLRRVIRFEASRKPYPLHYAHYHKKNFVPKRLESVVMSLVEHRPKQRRYKTAAEIIAELA